VSWSILTFPLSHPFGSADLVDVTQRERSELKQLEGHRVSLALADGSRIDDCELVSVGGGRRGHLWVHANGADSFVPLSKVADIWEASGRAGHG